MNNKIYLKYIHNNIIKYYIENSKYPNIILISQKIYKEMLKEDTYDKCKQLFGVNIMVSDYISEIVLISN